MSAHQQFGGCKEEKKHPEHTKTFPVEKYTSSQTLVFTVQALPRCHTAETFLRSSCNRRATEVKAVKLRDLWRNKTSSAAWAATRSGIHIKESLGEKKSSTVFWGFFWFIGVERRRLQQRGECCETLWGRAAVNQQPPPLLLRKHWKAWGISLIHGLRKWGWEIAEWLHKGAKRPQWNSGSILNKEGWLVVLFEAGVWSEVL